MDHSGLISSLTSLPFTLQLLPLLSYLDNRVWGSSGSGCALWPSNDFSCISDLSIRFFHCLLYFSSRSAIADPKGVWGVKFFSDPVFYATQVKARL